MRWLCSRMNYEGNVPSVVPEEIKDGSLLTNIDTIVPISWDGRFQLLAHPVGGGRRSKKITPHVIIDSYNMHSFGREITDCFRSDKPRGPGDECKAHACSLPTGTVDCAAVPPHLASQASLDL